MLANRVRMGSGYSKETFLNNEYITHPNNWKLYEEQMGAYIDFNASYLSFDKGDMSVLIEGNHNDTGEANWVNSHPFDLTDFSEIEITLSLKSSSVLYYPRLVIGFSDEPLDTEGRLYFPTQVAVFEKEYRDFTKKPNQVVLSEDTKITIDLSSLMGEYYFYIGSGSVDVLITQMILKE